MKEYIVYDDSERFFEIEQLSHNRSKPSAFNSMVNIKKFKITVEEISETPEILKKRLQDLYNKEDNWHNKEALNQYSKRMFGVIVNDLDKNFSEVEKIDIIKKIIDLAMPNERIDLTHLNWDLSSIIFMYSEFGEKIYFWGIDYNYKVNQRIGGCSGQTFKTLAGAKRNLLKYLDIK